MSTPLNLDLIAAWTNPMYDVHVVDEVGSTNEALVAEASLGAAEGRVIVAERQTQGRGRLDRTWEAPGSTGLTFSLLLRPGARVSMWGWIPILVGVGLHDAVSALGASAYLKWPNDLQFGADRRKGAGILAQSVAASKPAVVVGVGLNVLNTASQLPPTGASLVTEGLSVERTAVLLGVLDAVGRRYSRWRSCDWDPERSGLAAAYRSACGTIGQSVSVELPSGIPLLGTAIGIDSEGRLLVDDSSTVHAISAGDVVHVRGAQL